MAQVILLFFVLICQILGMNVILLFVSVIQCYNGEKVEVLVLEILFLQLEISQQRQI